MAGLGSADVGTGLCPIVDLGSVDVGTGLCPMVGLGSVDVGTGLCPMVGLGSGVVMTLSYCCMKSQTVSDCFQWTESALSFGLTIWIHAGNTGVCHRLLATCCGKRMKVKTDM